MPGLVYNLPMRKCKRECTEHAWCFLSGDVSRAPPPWPGFCALLCPLGTAAFSRPGTLHTQACRHDSRCFPSKSLLAKPPSILRLCCDFAASDLFLRRQSSRAFPVSARHAGPAGRCGGPCGAVWGRTARWPRRRGGFARPGSRRPPRTLGRTGQCGVGRDAGNTEV